MAAAVLPLPMGYIAFMPLMGRKCSDFFVAAVKGSNAALLSGWGRMKLGYSLGRVHRYLRRKNLRTWYLRDVRGSLENILDEKAQFTTTADLISCVVIQLSHVRRKYN
mmetsp:Transcript_1427/g.6229  ORF Transcript_1427/g.6229 Transcript_1427/m.6229 type:complete len:108 (-) Transcript_1427:1955-2278(-)|eukprot:scaffold5113_cov364-Pinguiococcus_pyrenoidosus.AAC.4